MQIAVAGGQNLRYLELPQNINSVAAHFFHTFLSNSPELRYLLVKGEPDGYDLLEISHPKLEFLELKCVLDRPLVVKCPNLTHLSRAGDASARKWDHYLVPDMSTPSIVQCSHPSLSPAFTLLKAVYAIENHALDITYILSYYLRTSPFMASTLFHSLRSLTVMEMRNDGVLGRETLHTYFPNLESLRLHGRLTFESGIFDFLIFATSRFEISRVNMRQRTI